MRTLARLSLALLLVLFPASGVRGKETALPFLSPVFGDHMVLQRDKPNTIWGWTRPGAEVRLELEGAGIQTMAGNDGRWSIRFAPPPAGGPSTVGSVGPERREL